MTGASAEAESKKFTKEQDYSELTAGLMWHVTRRASRKYGLVSEVTSFIPVNENVEVMYVKIRNTEQEAREFTPIAAIPIYGRSADNIKN